MSDRWISKDTSTVQIDTGTSILATVVSWEIESNRPPIDVSAIADDYDTTREGSYNYTVRFEKVLETESTIFDMFLTGGVVTWSVLPYTGKKTYSGQGRMTNARHSSGGRNARQLESCVLTGTGAFTHS